MIHIEIQTPDDWHLHFRDGDMLNETVSATARCFKRAIVMPNLVPPVTNAKMVEEYRQRILDARPEGSDFEPLMTLYLTNETTSEDIVAAKQAGTVAAKLYPAGATTNSDAAVKSLVTSGIQRGHMKMHLINLLIKQKATKDQIDKSEEYFKDKDINSQSVKDFLDLN